VRNRSPASRGPLEQTVMCVVSTTAPATHAPLAERLRAAVRERRAPPTRQTCRGLRARTRPQSLPSPASCRPAHVPRRAPARVGTLLSRHTFSTSLLSASLLPGVKRNEPRKQNGTFSPRRPRQSRPRACLERPHSPRSDCPRLRRRPGGLVVRHVDAAQLACSS
jgi:hypothetical protein